MPENDYRIDYGNLPYDIQLLGERVQQTAQDFRDRTDELFPEIRMREEEERIRQEEEKKRNSLPWHSKLGYHLMTVPQDSSPPLYSRSAADRLMVGDFAGAEAIQKPINTLGAISVGAGLLGAAGLSGLFGAAATYGWPTALAAEGLSWGTGTAGYYGFDKLGQAIDNKYGTNTRGWLSFLGSMGTGVAGYNAGLKGATKFAKYAINNGIRGYGDFKPAITDQILNPKTSSKYISLDNLPPSAESSFIPSKSTHNSTSILDFERITSGKPIFGLSDPKTNPDLDDALAIRDFAQQFGYKVPIGIERYSGEMLDAYYKKILKQHNTFGRGIAGETPEHNTIRLVYPYSKSKYHGETMPFGQNGVYTLASTSPFGSISGVIQRTMDFTGPRNTWIQKNTVQPRHYSDVTDAIFKKLSTDPVIDDFLLRDDYKGRWNYLKNKYPKLFDSRGRIFTQTYDPNSGTFVIGGIDGHPVGTVRRTFIPYSSDPKPSTRGFTKMKAKIPGMFDNSIKMLDDGTITGFNKGGKINIFKTINNGKEDKQNT